MDVKLYKIRGDPFIWVSMTQLLVYKIQLLFYQRKLQIDRCINLYYIIQIFWEKKRQAQEVSRTTFLVHPKTIFLKLKRQDHIPFGFTIRKYSQEFDVCKPKIIQIDIPKNPPKYQEFSKTNTPLPNFYVNTRFKNMKAILIFTQTDTGV